MILEKQSENFILSEGDLQDTTDMSLDLDSADFLMTMLSKNIYQEPISSLIREYSSNALDSNRRNNSTTPIVVSLVNNQENWEFSVEDQGTGLSKEEFLEIMTKYGKSTKREKSNELGCFGIGSKSGLAYSSTVYFLCRKKQKEVLFMMYEGEDKNLIDILYESETLEKNGVKVIIPVKHSDKYYFTKSIKEQLAYFEDVYFNVDDIKNDFKIYRSEDFQYSELCNDNDLHICLDNCYYPLDFNKLGISRISIPVGLNFSLSDGIQPTINRESIRYTKKSKEIILNKIKKVAEWFVSKYNEEITGKDFNIKAAFQHLRNPTRYYKGFGRGGIAINDILPYSSISIENPKVEGIDLLDLRSAQRVSDYILQEYKVAYTYSSYNNRFSSYRNQKLGEYFLDKPVYIFSDEFSRKKQNFMRGQLRGQVYFIIKDQPIPLHSSYNSYNNWVSILGLKNYPKNQWRQLITEAKKVQQLLLSNVIDLDKIEISKEWIEEKKKQRQYNKTGNTTTKVEKVEGKVIIKVAVDLDRSSSKNNCKFLSENLDVSSIYKNKKPYVFCLENDENEQIIQEWYNPIKNKVTLCMISKREYNKVKDIKNYNWIKLEDFVTCKHKILRRLGTVSVLSTFDDEYNSIFNNSYKFEKISLNLKNRIDNVNNYISKHRNYSIKPDHPIVKTVIENNLFDSTIYSDMLYLKKIFEKHTYINRLMSDIRWFNSMHVIILRDLCKYHKLRIDYVPKTELEKEEED